MTVVRMAGVRHTWPVWSGWPSWCLRRSDARTGVPATDGTRPSAWTRGWSLRQQCGHGNSRDGHLSGTAATAGHGRFRCGEHGRCAAVMATRLLIPDRCGSVADTARHFRCGRSPLRPRCGHRRRACRVRCPPVRVWWLGEPAAGSAAGGGMQPAPVDAGKSGGQATAELAANIGHRRPGE
jgi:hypothetical protein